MLLTCKLRKYPDKLKFKVELEHTLPAHKDCIYACAPIDSTQFYTAGGDGYLLKWDLQNTNQAYALAKVDSSIYAIVRTENNTVLIATNSGEVHIIDEISKEVLASSQLLNGVFSVVETKSYFIAGTANGYIYQLNKNDLSINLETKISTGHIRKIIKSYEGFLAGTSANEIIELNADLSINRAIKNAHNDSVFSLFKHPKGFLLSGGKDAILKKWNWDMNESEIEVPAHLFAINDLIFYPEYDRIISASRDKSIKIWDTQTLLLEKVIDRTKHNGASSHSVNRLCMLDNESLVAVGDDKIVRVYRIIPVK